MFTVFTTVCKVKVDMYLPDGPYMKNGEYAGYIEKDSLPGWTDDAESVRVGDTVEQGVIIHDACRNW